MTPDPLTVMEFLRPIEFTDALKHLQGMIGGDVKVVVNHYGRFFGFGAEGELDCVQTLPPDDTAIQVVLDSGAGFFLDPVDVEVFVGRDSGEELSWLEFRLSFGAVVTIGVGGL